MTQEEKAKRFDEVVSQLNAMMPAWELLSYNGKTFLQDIVYIFPELKEPEDEKIRKMLIDFFKDWHKTRSHCWNIPIPKIIAWLEKQGKETSWKPSKEEMDVLYGLAYITNQYDERKEDVITRLYQDLKREFFNGSSFENMFPNTEDDVRRRSTIQVLEYARSLDTYNQYGKADIDKNIAWLEKQGETYTKKDVDNAYIEGMAFAKDELEKQNKQNLANSAKTCKDEQKPADKVEPKFKVGDWIVTTYGKVNQIISVDNIFVEKNDDGYTLDDGTYFSVSWCDMYHLWTIQDAKDGDVLYSPCLSLLWIFKSRDTVYCGCNLNYNDGVFCGEGYFKMPTDAIPSTKEQRDLLFQKMKEAGFVWDAGKKKLKEIDTYCQENCKGYQETGRCFVDGDCEAKRKAEQKSQRMISAEAKEALYDKPTWSEEDERMRQCLLQDQEKALDDVRNDKYGHSEIISDLKEMYRERINWLKSLKDRYTWKPSEGHIGMLHDAFIEKACEWLKSNLYDYAGLDDKLNVVPFDSSIFEDFKKAMKEE